MNIPKKQVGGLEIYLPSFKIAIAREYLTTSLGFTKLAKKYNLPSEATPRYFLKWYRNKYPDGIAEPFAEDKDDEVSKEYDELKEANLKVTALEMLIENASKELGVDLIKKFGTKQPKK
jgi:transposase-like protein